MEDQDPNDETFVINTPKQCHIRNTPYKNITRSGRKSLELPPKLSTKMDQIIEEREKILKKAFTLCSQLRTANFGTVIRTVNKLLQDESKDYTEKGNIDEIKLLTNNFINNESKNTKLKYLDDQLDMNSDELRSVTLQIQNVLQQQTQSLKSKNSERLSSGSPTSSQNPNKATQNLHPAALFMELKNQELESHELAYQNKHLCFQLDQVFNEWQRSVSINKTLLAAFNSSYRALEFHDMLAPKIREHHEKVNRALGLNVMFSRVGLEQTKIIKNTGRFNLDELEDSFDDDIGQGILLKKNLGRPLVKSGKVKKFGISI